MWFLQAKGGVIIKPKEIPMDVNALNESGPHIKPDTMLQALMEAVPGSEPESSREEESELKNAILDCMEMLTAQDKFIIDAITYEMISYSQLGDRLRSFFYSCVEINKRGTAKP